MVDFFSHALWAYALFHARPDALAYAASAVLPDLAWGIPAVLLFFASGRKFSEMRKWRKLPHEEMRKRFRSQPYFESVRAAYHASHSWLVAALASLVVWAFAPKIALAFFSGVFLHLAMDVFVHKDSVNGQEPFYPLSHWRAPSFVHWSNKKFIAANYALLAIVYALILLGRV
ncbi:MAG: metal-dependent hydrolase [Candidatus Micrarchaeota archaeon]